MANEQELFEYRLKRIKSEEFLGVANGISMEMLKKKTKSVFRIMKKGPVIWKLILEDDTVVRLDKNYKQLQTRLQEIAWNNGGRVNKVYGEIPMGRAKFKLSEWIDGKMVYNFPNDANVYREWGETMALLNLITYKSLFLCNSEASGPNTIFSNVDKKVYIVDHDRLRAHKNPNGCIVQLLLKRVREKQRFNLFIEGYKKHRPVEGIMAGMKKRNWEWSSEGKTRRLRKLPPAT